jgi:hypothetical protein
LNLKGSAHWLLDQTVISALDNYIWEVRKC